MIPITIDPATGARLPLFATPAGYVPVHGRSAVSSAADVKDNFLHKVIRVFGCASEPAKPATGAFASPAPKIAQERVSPIRQPEFESVIQPPAPDLQPPTAAEFQVLVKTLSGAKVKLELATIADWDADFKSEVGRADAQALLLLESADWRSLLSDNTVTWPIAANKRIATYISANIDKSADRVRIFLDRVRSAEQNGRPGISFSGIWIRLRRSTRW